MEVAKVASDVIFADDKSASAVKATVRGHAVNDDVRKFSPSQAPSLQLLYHTVDS